MMTKSRNYCDSSHCNVFPEEYPPIANRFRISSYVQHLAKLQMHHLRRKRIKVAITTLYDILNGHWNHPSIEQTSKLIPIKVIFIAPST